MLASPRQEVTPHKLDSKRHLGLQKVAVQLIRAVETHERQTERGGDVGVSKALLQLYWNCKNTRKICIIHHEK